jgi:aryl-alcohol dehydrogenase-like predicted oxidoreductase
METARLGHTPYRVSRFILGCGNFGGVGSDPRFFGMGEAETDAFALMGAAWDAGINCFDTADAYGGGRSETYIGKWSAKTARHPIVCTKVFHSVDGNPDDFGLDPDRIRRQIEGSLTRLQRERVDLYLIHEPDERTPLESTLEALDGLVRSGTVGAIGACNVDADYLARSLETCDRRGFVRFESVQNEYNLINRGVEAGVLRLCMQHGLGFTPFSPLCGGWLTGKYKRDTPAPAGSRMTLRPEPYRDVDQEGTYRGLDRLRDFAADRNQDMSALALAWVSGHPGVTATVIGPRRPAHLAPVTSAMQIELSEADRETMAEFFAG